MAELDPSIILQGQPVNVLGAMDSGFQLAQRRNEMQRQREYQNMLATNWAGILSGDQNALNALAGFDPQAAMGIQGQRLDMARTQQGMAFDVEEMQMRRETAKREAERYAATLSAEEAQAQAAQIEKAVAAGMAAQSPEQWDALVTQMGATDLVGQFGNRQVIAYTYMGVADALKASTPAEPADEYGRYVQETTARGQQPLDRIGYEQAKKSKGFSVTTADGTQIQYGGPAGGQSQLGYNPMDVDAVVASIDAIANDPNLSRVVGPLEGGGGNNIDDLSDARRMYYGPGGTALVERIGQLQSTTWLAARQMLKGGGAITDYESRKAEAAMARLSRAKGEAEFKAALKDLRDAVTEGQAKLAAAGMGGQQPVQQTGQQPASQPAEMSDDDLLNLYGGE